jgi:glucokinase
MTLLAGVDIGGTKCAVCLAQETSDRPRLLASRRFATPLDPQLALARVIDGLEHLRAEHGAFAAVGVSCGGPLDSRRGLVLSPPNLPGWHQVDVLSSLRAAFHVPAGLQNDANACALAEWRWGAGRGCQNMIFLTFGTGMGAGLILDGRLYSGTNDLAGEVGHLRLAPDGPLGYGKAGSFEGFCSGGGIVRLARSLAAERLAAHQAPSFCPDHASLETLTAESVALAAQDGDPLAMAVFETAARYLGRGLAVLVDILNPQRIVIGSIYTRQRALLEPLALQSLQAEALPLSLSVCSIVPAELGEAIGDFASLSVALEAVNDRIF